MLGDGANGAIDHEEDNQQVPSQNVALVKVVVKEHLGKWYFS
jgi:hypothetical protein